MRVHLHPEHGPFTETIIHHWKTHFPVQAAQMEKAGTLTKYALAAQERAGRVHEQALGKGLSYSQAEELALEEWGKPPNAS